MNQAVDSYLVHVFIDRAVSAELSVFYIQVGRRSSPYFTELRLRVRTPEIRRVRDTLVVDSCVERAPVNVATSRDQALIEEKPEDLASYSAQFDVATEVHHAYIRDLFVGFLHSGTLVYGPCRELMEGYPEPAQRLVQEVAKGWRDLMLEKAENVLYDADVTVSQVLREQAERGQCGGVQDRPVTGVVLDW